MNTSASRTPAWQLHEEAASSTARFPGWALRSVSRMHSARRRHTTHSISPWKQATNSSWFLRSMFLRLDYTKFLLRKTTSSKLRKPAQSWKLSLHFCPSCDTNKPRQNSRDPIRSSPLVPASAPAAGDTTKQCRGRHPLVAGETARLQVSLQDGRAAIAGVVIPPSAPHATLC